MQRVTSDINMPGRAVSPKPPRGTGDERDGPGGPGETALPQKLHRRIVSLRVQFFNIVTDVTQRVGPDLVSGRELPVCLPRVRGLTQGQALQNQRLRTIKLESDVTRKRFFGRAISLRPPEQAGGLPELSRWLTERGSAEMASPQAMAQRAGHDRVPALAGGHGHNEAWQATPPDIIADKNRIPEGCQKRATWVSGIPPGCIRFFIHNRWCRSRCSLNHRLISGKPPACSGGLGETALSQNRPPRNTS
jgi:hypothetical protein